MRIPAIALALALALPGCGGKKGAANAPSNNEAAIEATNKPPSEYDNQAFATGLGKASRTVRYWDVEFQSSTGIGLTDASEGMMKGVKGVIYIDGAVAYSFESKKAEAFLDNDKLLLVEDVKITDEFKKTEVPVSQVTFWDPQTAKFSPPKGSFQFWDFNAKDPGRYSRSKKLWDIEWKSANLVIKQVKDMFGEMKSKQFGTMKGVKGVVYDNGKIASTFSAELAEAFETDDRLKLSGKVVLTAITIDKKDNSKKTTVLKSNEVLWDPQKKQYVARGAVEVDSPSGYLAPTDKVLASSNLDKIATSEDYFKK